MKYAILTVLCLAGVVFGAYSYDASTQTLSLDQADLVNVIDPAGLADVQQSFGVDINTFRALPGLKVIDFGDPTGPAVANPTSLQVNGLVKFNFSTAFDNGDTGYWWGGRNSYGRSAFSGANTYSDISTVETQPDNSWFDVASIAGANLTAAGFCLCTHNSSNYYLSAGTVEFLLDDGTMGTVDYPTLGSGTSPMLNQVFFGYQAPAGRHIVGIHAVRPGGGTSYVAIDDLSFTVQQAALPWPGDINGDGRVDVVDLGILAKNYDWVGAPDTSNPPIHTWGMGDFNNDGTVDVVDLGILSKNYDWGTVGIVPEPMTLGLLAVGAAAVVRRKR